MKTIIGKNNEMFVRLNGVQTGIVKIPFDTSNKKDWFISATLPLTGGSKLITFRQVQSVKSLKHFNDAFYIGENIIIVHTRNKFKRPLFKVVFTEDFAPKWKDNELYTNVNFKKLKRKTAPYVVPCKKTKSKIAWGGSSDNQACIGLHHILESHSYRVGKGEIVLDGSFFVYREKGKQDLLVAQCYLDDDQEDVILWRKIKSKKVVFNDEEYKLLEKCWAKIARIFASSSYSANLIKNALSD
jgi:hypothetical protein